MKVVYRALIIIIKLLKHNAMELQDIKQRMTGVREFRYQDELAREADYAIEALEDACEEGQDA